MSTNIATGDRPIQRRSVVSSVCPTRSVGSHLLATDVRSNAHSAFIASTTSSMYTKVHVFDPMAASCTGFLTIVRDGYAVLPSGCSARHLKKVGMYSNEEQQMTWSYQWLSVVLLTTISYGMQTAVLLAQLTPATPLAGFQGIWYEVGPAFGSIPNKYGGGLATYPQQIGPLAVYSPEVDRTYFVFNVDVDPGPGRSIGHAISYFDHATRQVARPQVWLNKETGDAHDAAVLALDDEGYLYMFSMTHGENRRSWIKKSGAPHDIASSRDLLSLTDVQDQAVFGALPGDSATTLRFSYASAWYVPNVDTEDKFLLLHTRYQSGQRDLFTTTSADADSWTTRKGLAQIESGQYQKSWIKPDGKTVGTIFNVHPASGGLDARTDLFYLETADQGQTWRSIDGSTIVDNSGPNDNRLITRPDQPQHMATQVYDAAPGERVYLKDINYDSQGRPVIMFLTSPTHVPGPLPEGSERTVRTAYWTGAEWSIQTVTHTDHNYDHGSLFVGENGNWRVIGAFIDGPQQFGTGGQIGMWTTADYGRSWSLQSQLTADQENNHTYPQRVVNGQDSFYSLWASGNAFEPSEVHFCFATKAGQVFELPFDIDTDFASPIPLTLSADYNGDGLVDAADYVLWRHTLGSTEILSADGNHSGVVDYRDYQLWRLQFQNGSSSASYFAVPEPKLNVLSPIMLFAAACFTSTCRLRAVRIAPDPASNVR